MSNPNSGLELYKSFVDGIVDISEGVHGRWATEMGWPKVEGNEKINEFLSTLSDDQRKTLASMLEDARSSGIHDTLLYLNEKILLDNMKIAQEGVEMATEPFGTELFYDWTCRLHGDTWPDEQT